MGKYFGTDGFRGRVGAFLNPVHAFKIGYFLGSLSEKGKILVAKDPRLSSDLLESSIVAGILNAGANAWLLGITSTPSVSYLMRNDFNFGVMISASHNPYYDNGIKIFESSGNKLSEEVENAIEAFIDNTQNIPWAKNAEIGRSFFYENGEELYLAQITKNMFIDTMSHNIIIDTANGSNYLLAEKLMNKLGIKARLINNQPDGMNINDDCGSLFLHQKLNQYQVNDFVVAFDGDGDRILFIYKNQLLTGDHILFVLAKFLKSHNLLNKNTIVTTEMANKGLLQALENYNINYLITDIGDKNVHIAMENNNLSLGGEQSGHIILNDYLGTGDGLLVMTFMLKILSLNLLDEYLADLTIYPQLLVSLNVVDKKAIMNNSQLNQMILEDNDFIGAEGRVFIRPSGTENKIRVMVEHSDIEKCQKLVDKYQALITLLNQGK